MVKGDLWLMFKVFFFFPRTFKLSSFDFLVMKKGTPPAGFEPAREIAVDFESTPVTTWVKWPGRRVGFGA